tara:strand:+ start:344 stop:679 length:336 start_codon:yes stop_codon:yes gene_type:complete
MSRRVPNAQGRISNLIRISADDWRLIDDYVKEHFSRKYEYYDASSQSFLDYYPGASSVQFVMTPVNVEYRAVAVYLDPDIHEKLVLLANQVGIALGRVIATAVTHMARSTD